MDLRNRRQINPQKVSKSADHNRRGTKFFYSNVSRSFFVAWLTISPKILLGLVPIFLPSFYLLNTVSVSMILLSSLGQTDRGANVSLLSCLFNNAA